MAPITSLPTELLVEIFSQLDYITLKGRVAPACRLFRCILTEAAYGKLARTLHRELMRPQDGKALSDQEGSPYSNYKQHPCLSFLSLRPGIDPTEWPVGIDNIGTRSISTGEFSGSITEFSLANENVTIPPTDFLVVRSTDGPCDRRPENTTVSGCTCASCTIREKWGVIDVRGRQHGITILEFLKKWDEVNYGHYTPPKYQRGYTKPPWKWANRLDFSIKIGWVDTFDLDDKLVRLLRLTVPGLPHIIEWDWKRKPPTGKKPVRLEEPQTQSGSGEVLEGRVEFNIRKKPIRKQLPTKEVQRVSKKVPKKTR